MSDKTPIELAMEMVAGVLRSRSADCADTDCKINHEAEVLAAELWNGYRRTYPAPMDMLPEEVPIFHLCHSLARIIVNARQGRVLWDKVVDVGGWAFVAADWLNPGKTDAY